MRITIHKLLAALALAGLLASCQKKEQDVAVKKALKVVRSEVIFGVEGGEGSILVEAEEAVTAVSERAWCQVAVDGNTIRVSVPEANPGKMSRYARIIIKSGAGESHVTALQYGEVFSGLEMEDLTVEPEGTEVRYSYVANMTVRLSSDQPWIHFTTDPETSVVTMKVDANNGFGYRFATVSYTAGTNSGSAQVIQETSFGELSGWTVEDTDGRFVFPDQIDAITVTPSAQMASVPYCWDLFDPDELDGEHILDFVKEKALSYKSLADEGKLTFCKGADTREFTNPRSVMKALVCCFDERNYPTGQYVLVDVAVPARGPVKQALDGWDIEHTDATWAYPNQTDVFTITPKAGYEDVKYIATVVKKGDVADVEDFAFTNFAMNTRQSILDKVTAGDLPSFEAGLSSGTTTVSIDNAVGDVYVVVVAFGDNKFYTGDYEATEFAVADIKPAMYSWVGSWKVVRKNDKYDTVDTWVISVKETDKTLRIIGVESFTDLTRYDVAATTDEEGRLVVKTQITGSYEDSSRGHVDVLLSGQYDDTKAGKTYYTSSLNVVLFRGTLSEDGASADLEPGVINGYYFNNIQFYGRYKNSSGGTSAVTWNAGPTAIPQTITRL